MSRPRKALRRFFSCRTPGAFRRLRAAGEEGFTLIELVITIVILPLIMGAIAVALFVTFSEQAGVSTRIATSADAQVTSAYFVRDVQSAVYVTTATTPTSHSVAWPSTAGPTTDCPSGVSGSTLLLSLAWPSGQQPIYDGVTVVSYWATASRVLERELCAGNATPSSSITSRDFLSPFPHVLLSCVTSELSCRTTATQRWVPAQWISGATLGVGEPLCASGAFASISSCNAPAGRYYFNLTAAPRASGSEGAYASGGERKPPRNVPPILALGKGRGVIKESGGKTTPAKTPITVTTTTFTKNQPASIKVITGPAALNTGYFDMANKTQFLAPNIEVTPGNTPCKSGTCGASSGKKAATVTLCATKKITASTNAPPTCYTPTPTHTKPWTTHSAVSDPFATLSDPTAVNLTYHRLLPCQVPSTGTLQPGEYDCGDGAPFNVNGTNVKVKLQRGIYIFDTGLKVQGNATLKGTTVLIYLPCKANDPWVPPNTLATRCSEELQVSNGHMSVTPLNTPNYSNLWFWQNKGDAAKVSMHGKGAISVTSGGVLYAPHAKVVLSGLGTGTTNVGAIVATTFEVANSHVKVRGFGT